MSVLQEFALEFGYLGLFILSILAETILPFSSEIVMALMPSLGYNFWLVLILATAGHYLGSIVNYFMGKGGGTLLFSRYFKVDPQTLTKSQKLYQRWGAPVLLFCGLPFVGDPLTIVAGFFSLNLFVFTIWVVTGKLARNLIVLGVVDALLSAA